MRQVSIKAGGAFVMGVVGLALMLWGVERASLAAAAAERVQGEATIPRGSLVALVIGVFLLTMAVFSALTVLNGYLRSHPSARQAPVWILVAVIVVAGGLGLTAYAIHNDSLRSMTTLPTTPEVGFIAGQVFVASVALSVLVILGVRWTPRHRPVRAQR